MAEDKFHYQFIHNVFGCFIEDTLEYFADYLYPRFEHTVIATYDKGVEYIVKQSKLGREGDKPNLPALILNPTGEFDLDDPNSLAHQLWRFPHLAPAQASGLFTPIYKDNNIEITVAFTRLKGEIELLALLPSFYEYFDLKIFLIQMFGGTGRYIQPIYFNDFIILPPELVNYRYENDITGESYQLDWSNNALDFLVKTTNRNELVIPGKVKPRYVLRGMSDGSNRYGGTDELASWRLSSTIEYEIEIPTFIYLKSDYIVENIITNIGYGSAYSTYKDYNIPEFKQTTEVHFDSGLQEDKNTININEDGDEFYNYQKPPPLNICGGDKIKRELVMKNRYFHKITQDQADSTADIIITLPEQIYEINLLTVQSKHGPMNYGTHYTIENEGKDLRIIVKNVNLNTGDMLELFVYESIKGANNPTSLIAGSSLISTTGETPNRASLIVELAFTSTAICTTTDQTPELTIV